MCGTVAKEDHMSKRRFRSAPSTSEPDYPTLESFDRGRRDFLARLGSAILGAGALGTGLAACGDRDPVNLDPDHGAIGGVARLPDAGRDSLVTPEDGYAPQPDARIDPPAGEPPMPDAGVDVGPTQGIAPAPDASVDSWSTGGAPRLPDAGGDRHDLGGPAGVAPMPDAGCDDDGGSCPVP
jgi:hypothetical protein